ncbi:MAG: aspartate kinase [Rickettsiales bacterium]|nr:aspartate kinase [Rickettsiales bacterium]MCA0254115.1 aspartate kinase [Pseudomonadota bacterium]
MQVIVQKFGGTSVADLERIRNVAKLVQKELKQGNKVIAIVSAMAGVTNSLIMQCQQLSRLDNIDSLREYDTAIASGETITSALLALELQTIGIKSKSLQGWQIPIKTSKAHGNAQVIDLDSSLLKNFLNNGITPVITGFQGVADDFNITTLGKGGSDTTAAVIAASINAHRCDIYTDVDGIYTADPRVVHNAKKIDVIDINQLYELCTSGAKVLHPRAALAAKRYGFNLRVLSSFDINSTGTTAINIIKNMENTSITAITSNKNLLKITAEHNAEILAQIIQAFAHNEVIIEQASSHLSKQSVLIVNLVDKNKCEKLLDDLKSKQLITKYSIDSNISSVTVVGYGIKNDSNLIYELIDLLKSHGISVFSADLSDLKFSIVVDDHDNEKTIKLLHDKCFPETS